MNTLTKLALGMIGQLKSRPAVEGPEIVLPPPRRSGGMALQDALQRRASGREFADAALGEQVMSDLLWSAAGVNRAESAGRTAPSAMNSQEVLLYVAMAQGLFLYDPASHGLRMSVASDVRRVTGYQDFVDTAPLDLVYVADHARMKLVPAAQRERYAFAAAGAMAQNVYLISGARWPKASSWPSDQSAQRGSSASTSIRMQLSTSVPAGSGEPK